MNRGNGLHVTFQQMSVIMSSAHENTAELNQRHAPQTQSTSVKTPPLETAKLGSNEKLWVTVGALLLL